MICQGLKKGIVTLQEFCPLWRDSVPVSNDWKHIKRKKLKAKVDKYEAKFFPLLPNSLGFNILFPTKGISFFLLLVGISIKIYSSFFLIFSSCFPHYLPNLIKKKANYKCPNNQGITSSFFFCLN